MSTATDSPLPTEVADYRVLDQRSHADRRADERLGRDVGLSADERAARLARYGPNTLEEKRHGVVLELLSDFWQPTLWATESALVLTALTRRWTDFRAICVPLPRRTADAVVRCLRQRPRRSRERVLEQTGPTHGGEMNRQLDKYLVNEAVDAYVDWREEAVAVWDAYQRWRSAPTADAPSAFAAYRAALDLEECASETYADLMGRIAVREWRTEMPVVSALPALQW
jgi:hypothetical protein